MSKDQNERTQDIRDRMMIDLAIGVATLLSQVPAGMNLGQQPYTTAGRLLAHVERLKQEIGA